MSGKIYAVCMGDNDYPGMVNDLAGCLNDARGWSGRLRDKFGAKIVDVVLDGSRRRRTAAMHLMRSLLTEDDTPVITNSSHGTYVVDKSGDESDRRDEAIVCADGRLIYDDETRGFLDSLPAPCRSRCVVINDACFGGTGTRAGAMTNYVRNSFVPIDRYRMARFMPPQALGRSAQPGLPLGRRLFGATRELSEEQMPELYLAGCSGLPGDEYSYDGWMDGQPVGAMSGTCFRILDGLDAPITWAQFFDLLRDELPSDQYPQSPQLEGRESRKYELMLRA